MKDDVPAFPHLRQNSVESDKGMTLRDYFAGQAMNSMGWARFDGPQIVSASQKAYLIADAMLKARETPHDK